MPPVLTSKKQMALGSAFGIQGARNSFGLENCHLAQTKYIAVHPGCLLLPSVPEMGSGWCPRGGGQPPQPSSEPLWQCLCRSRSMVLTSASERGAKPHGVQ